MKVADAILELQATLQIPEEKRSPHIGPLTRDRFKLLGSLDPDAEWEPAAPPAPAKPVPVPAGFPPEGAELILDAEGIDQPGEWPGGSSGITLGAGVDIGADPPSLEFWRGILTDDQIDRLATAKGITGRAAAQIAGRFGDIHVTREQAMQVFAERTLPREIKLTLRTFPGIDKFPPQVLGAMTSIVFNRGSDLSGGRRMEMKRIADLIASGPDNLNDKLDAIADQIVAMKRLWGKGQRGLLVRRDNEAALVRSAIT